MNNYKILVVDDENDICELIKDILLDENYEAITSNNQYQAMEIIKHQKIDLILLDIWLEDQNDGIDLLQYIKNNFAEIPVIMISGHGNIKLAVQAIKLGAYDYIEKPFHTDKLKIIVRRALEVYILQCELNKKIILANKFIEIIGSSKVINEIRHSSNEASKSDSRILITGEKGTGKELIARFIHKNSKYNCDPFTIITPLHPLVINNLNINQIDLSGTVFIDEITDFPIYFQKSLLSWINKIQFELNDNKCRIIASTSKDIKGAVQHGIFNIDLYERLRILTIAMPKLSDHIDDIPDLCQFFINYFMEASGLNSKIMAEDAIYKLQSFSWPENVTQLKNIIEWLMITYNKEPIIYSTMLTPDIFNEDNEGAIKFDEILPLSLKDAREAFEKYYLLVHLKRNGGSISRTAEHVEMDRSALHRKLKLMNIEFNN